MQKKDIFISTPDSVNSLIHTIATQGKERFFVLSDFDRTLTKAYVNGKKTDSLISVLRDQHLLTPEYSHKAQELYERYHTVEDNPALSLAQQKQRTREWWQKHFNLLIASGLNKKHIEQVIQSPSLQLKDLVPQTITYLHTHQIPLVIFSSSGLGGDAISLYLQQQGLLYENVHIISNRFTWDENGYATGVYDPIVHGMNKEEILLQELPLYTAIQDRPNILLLGDSISDRGMANTLTVDNVLSIGFLNTIVDNPTLLAEYQRTFDAVVQNDLSFEYAYSVIQQLVPTKE